MGEPCPRCVKLMRKLDEEIAARRAAVKAVLAARAAFDQRALAEAEESLRKAREACARTRAAVQEGEAGR